MYPSFNRVLCLATIVGLTGAATGSAAGAPEEDLPLKIIQTTRLELGHLPADGSVPTSGEVRVLALIDNTGQLHDVLLLGSTHNVFTTAAVKGLQEWQFVPPQVNGQAIGARVTLRLFIEAGGRVTTATVAEAVADRVRPAHRTGFESRLAEADELDRPLQFVRRASPLTPVELAGQSREATRVVLDFYVDETGRPRMAMVKQSAEPLLSEAALDALERWLFEPPTRDGLPVIVRAQQEFVFFDSPPSGDIAPADAATTE